MNVEDLDSLHGDTREDARYDGAGDLHMGVRHEDIQPNEHSRHQDVWDTVYQETHGRPQQQEVGQGVGNSGHEDGDTRRQDDDDGEAEKHGQIVGEGAKEGARFLHLPYLIERLFHVADQHQHRIEHKQQTNAEEDTALGVYQIAVDKADDNLSSLWLRL